MSKRARHVESNQRVTGYPQKTGWDPTWVKHYLCFQRRFNPRIQVGRNPSISTVCVPSEGGKKRWRARHLWYDYGAKKQPQRTEHGHA